MTPSSDKKKLATSLRIRGSPRDTAGRWVLPGYCWHPVFTRQLTGSSPAASGGDLSLAWAGFGLHIPLSIKRSQCVMHQAGQPTWLLAGIAAPFRSARSLHPGPTQCLEGVQPAPAGASATE